MRAEQWQSMAGRAGQLHTGHCLIRVLDHSITHVDSETSITTVHFGTPSDADLEAYLASGEPLRVAGAFTLDGLGGWFVDGVRGRPVDGDRREPAAVALTSAAVWAVGRCAVGSELSPVSTAFMSPGVP